MKIAIDARLNAYRTGGIAQYTQQLLHALAEIAPADQFVALEHRKQTQPLVIASNVRRRRLWTPPHHRLEQWSLPFELRDLHADLLHSPDFIPPLRQRGPLVITVHDLAFIRYPDILDEAARQYYGQIQAAVQRADAIIAVSESTKHDLIELLQVAPHRIDVVYEAAAPYFRQLDLAPHAQHSFNGHPLQAGTFALFVGTIEPRKNLITLLDALALCHEEQGEEIPHLVVAGARGWLEEPIFAQIKELGLERYVTFLGAVDQASLVWLYNACRFYINPELYSGFGLPILEAMQCGAPVVAADTSALPEVVGDAGLLVRPMDVSAWASVLTRLWHDRTLRADLRVSGLMQARQFSWRKAAAQTLAIYQRVAKRGTG